MLILPSHGFKWNHIHCVTVLFTYRSEEFVMDKMAVVMNKIITAYVHYTEGFKGALHHFYT